MPKSLVLGNGNILIALDAFAQVKDFYFPYVGMENQTAGKYVHKIGVFADGRFHWFDDGTWNITVDCAPDTLASVVSASHEALGIAMKFTCVVYNERNIFIREVVVTNKKNENRTIKIFFHQAFELYESHRGDTAYFDPMRNALIHYKGRRVFLINARLDGRGFDDYCVGLFHIEGKEGTYKDAEDGMLSKNAVEHGMVDSVLGMTVSLEPGQSRTLYYWICVAKLYKDVLSLNSYVQNKTPLYLMKTTKDFWHAWINRTERNFEDLSPELISLYKKSLLFMRTHVDNNGSILASGDSDMLQYGRDCYSYMWPRDAAYAAIALARSGDVSVAKKFFEFCNEVVMEEGYFLHKYRPDSSLGSSWHPWVRDGVASLPIQEDETAVVVYALWEYYQLSKDLEFVELVYNSLIKKTAYFMVEFVDPDTGLPKPSYDLWEEKYGVHTYTAASTVGGLEAAAKFAKLLGKTESERLFRNTAERMRSAILAYLYNEKEGYFYKMITKKNGRVTYDTTVDVSSVYGIFKFAVLSTKDKHLQRAVETTIARTSCPSPVDGLARYEGDRYFSVENDVAGNPWFITTLWLAQYQIAQAATIEELAKAKKWLQWVLRHSIQSGILSEQLHPKTGAQLSVAPLTWSHSEYVVTVLEYLAKLNALKR